MELSLDRPPPPGPPPRGLTRDPLVWVAVVVWILSVLPSVAPILPPAWTLNWADLYSDIPTYLLVLYAVVRAIQLSTAQRERGFWRLLAGMTLAFLAVRGVYTLVPLDYWGTGVDLASDILYLAGYLCIAFALERRPDRSPPTGAEGRLHQVETLGVLTFAFGLLTYFVLIPSVFNPEVYASWVSSLLLYAVLDVYLLIRCISLLKTDPGPEWRVPYRWMVALFALWFVGDLTEGLIYMEILPWVDPGTPADILWLLPCLVLLLAVRSRGAPDGRHGSAGGDDHRGTGHKRPPASLLAMMGLGLPALHFLLLGLGLGDPASEGPREILLFVLLATLAGLLAVRHRLLNELTASLEADRNQAASQLQMARRLEAVGRMAAGIAHDFSNVLSVVRGRGELLLSGAGSDDPSVDVRVIVDAARRGEALAGRLMALGRPAEVADATPVILGEVVQDLKPLLERVLPASIDLKVELRSRHARTVIQRTQVEQILLNLVLNARDAMQESGRIRIALDTVEPSDDFVTAHGGTRSGSYVVLRVSDDGPGIPAELRHQVMEPFFTTKPDEAGGGLGLSIVYGLVRGAGGFLHIGDASEGGTMVALYLPRVADGAAGVSSPARPAKGEAPERGHGTIMVVEDYDALRVTCARILQEAGFRVIEAATAADALAILERRREDIDLVLADLVLPDHAGYDLTELIAKRRPDVPVLFMTGYPQGVTPLRAADGPPVLEKPFTPAALLVAVRNALATPGRSTG